MVHLRTHAALAEPELQAGWAALVEADPHATVFHTPRYLGVWQRELGSPTQPRIRAVYRDDELIGVVPEQLEREGGATRPVVLRFLGGTDVTDYLGPVSRIEDREAVVAAWLEGLEADHEWDEVVAGGLAEDAGWHSLLLDHAQRFGLVVTGHDVEDVCPRVDLAGGYEAYLEALPGKLRQEQRRKTRKLARDAGEVAVVPARPGELAAALEGFFALAANAEPEKARFFVDDGMRGFFVALAEEFGGDGTLRVHALEVGGRPVAATVSLVDRGEWGLYNSAFDPVLGGLAPGMVLVGELIRAAADEGVEVFDLLRGDEPYKYRFGAVGRRLHRVTLGRR